MLNVAGIPGNAGIMAKLEKKVRISIAGKTREKAVTPEDTRASFVLNLKAGNSDLETALLGDGIDGIAYFVTAEYLGE